MNRRSNTWRPGFKTLKGAIKVSNLEVGLELTTYLFRHHYTPFHHAKTMFAAGFASLNRKATREHTLASVVVAAGTHFGVV